MARLAVLAVSTVLILVEVVPTPTPTVTTRSGRLRGKYVTTREGRTVAAFLGIPFAKPPLGDLRFQPPQPADPWPQALLVDTQPTPCVQALIGNSSEDCLYLNVYTPDIESRPRLPVYVYIHGGFFEAEGAFKYTHEYLMDEDIVYVVVQYRLGLFGFLSTNDEVIPGNMGIKDVRCALRWIQKNIKFFGGDPEKVTIVGESAGAIIVHYLLLFAADEGLFRAGISQSGTALFTWAFHPPVEVDMMVRSLAKHSGCPVESQGFLECLRAKSAQEILMIFAMYKFTVYYGLEVITVGGLPLLGGVVEPECVEDRLVTGNPWQYNVTLPWLVGVNSAEALFVFTVQILDRTNIIFTLLDLLFNTYFPLAANYQNSKADGSSIASDFRDFYLDYQPINRPTLRPLVTGASDAFFTYGTYEAVMRADKEKTFVYYMDYKGAHQNTPIPPDARIGTSHGDELFFFYPHPFSSFNDRAYDTVEDIQFSKTLIQLWTNFVGCLNPTPERTCNVQWEPFSNQELFLNFTQNRIELQEKFLPERMSFWKSVPFPSRDETLNISFSDTHSEVMVPIYKNIVAQWLMDLDEKVVEARMEVPHR